MNLNKLFKHLAPPDEPCEPCGKRYAEKKLGLRLPKEYLDYLRRYGSGQIIDEGVLEIFVYNPCSPQYDFELAQHTAILETALREKSQSDLKLSAFPATPGMLAIASDDNGNEVYFLTDGQPDQWPIIVRTPEGVIFTYRTTFVEFLESLILGKLDESPWNTSFFKDITKVYFKPKIDNTKELKEEPKSIFTIYIENGCRANFWVRHFADQKAVTIRINSINGSESGELPGLPPDYNGSLVDGDLYVGSVLEEAHTGLDHAYQDAFIHIPSVNP
ncbi:SMI1/KNR4 family protein [Planctopirus hydrillae]|uniref:Knr4/Smi1-like domain-containing protein n=1 Tax=Planctopirus hydrillae TaxID=1841610 RepID=A0A1C3ETU3_9PLAN|nr:SMI1/KNR4 family protein [Planctopirus hydrillae]ODA36605.1 hypothetical protein A6X21_15840 [Planctopirus hydrillae]